MKKLLVLFIAMVLILGAALVSCDDVGQNTGDFAVTVEVDCKEIAGRDGAPTDGTVISSFTVYVDDGSSAYDALAKACRLNKVACVASGNKGSEFIESIDGIKNAQYGEMSGWYYLVNGEMLMVGCGEYKVKKDDKITFAYTADFNKLYN